METFIAQSKTQKLPSVRHSIDRHLYSSQPGRSVWEDVRPVTRESPGSVISWVILDSLAASPGLEYHMGMLEIAPDTHSFHSV